MVVRFCPTVVRIIKDGRPDVSVGYIWRVLFKESGRVRSGVFYPQGHSAITAMFTDVSLN